MRQDDTAYSYNALYIFHVACRWQLYVYMSLKTVVPSMDHSGSISSQLSIGSLSASIEFRAADYNQEDQKSWFLYPSEEEILQHERLGSSITLPSSPGCRKVFSIPSSNVHERRICSNKGVVCEWHQRSSLYNLIIKFHSRVTKNKLRNLSTSAQLCAAYVSTDNQELRTPSGWSPPTLIYYGASLLKSSVRFIEN